MITKRTVIKIERNDSPNGRYPYTISFAKDGKWYDANYTQTAEEAEAWAEREISEGTYAGPVIVIAEAR